MTDKTLFTPHIGSAVTTVRKQVEALAAKSCLAVLANRPPLNPVT